MNVLLDHCVPKQFGRLLVGNDVRTASEMGWEGLSNGELLKAAAVEFAVLITVDRNLRFQQYQGDLMMTVIALLTLTNKLEDLEPAVPEVLRVLGSRPAKRVYVIDARG